MIVTLGNVAPVEIHHHDHTNWKHRVRHAEQGGTIVSRGDWFGTELFHRVVTLDPMETPFTWTSIPTEWSTADTVSTLATGWPHPMWNYHSTEAPSWILVSDDDEQKAAETQAALEDAWNLTRLPHGTLVSLVTNAGLDYASKQLGGAASATAIAIYMALTQNATGPGAGDTTLTAEIVTAGGGLLRAATAYGHGAGASTYTLGKTFTANANDSFAATINKMGIFDATSSGNMPFETAVTPAITFNANGDQGTITETVTV